MTKNTTLSGPTGDFSAIDQEPVCPLCTSPLIRIRRRFADRLLSLVVPVQRYQCSARRDNSFCDWEGVLRIHPNDKMTHLRFFPGDTPAKTGGTDALNKQMNHHPVQRKMGDAPVAAFSDITFEDMAQITLDAIGDAVLVVDPEGTVIYLNKVAEKLTGWSQEKAIRRPVEGVFNIVDGNTRERIPSPSQQAINEGRIVALALGSMLIRQDGSDIEIEDSAAPIYNRHGEVAGAVIVFHDASKSSVTMEKMSHLAQHDSLTGLPNRVLLMERLTQAIGMARRHNKQLALLFLDLDHFKPINDSFGHAMGDLLLQEIAADIVTCVRTTDTVSRHGGDEFVILLTQVEELHDAARVAEKLLARISRPRIIAEHEIQVSLSIGISVYPDNGSDGGTLLRNADAAMYIAKKNGRNAYQFCNRKTATPLLKDASL